MESLAQEEVQTLKNSVLLHNLTDESFQHLLSISQRISREKGEFLLLEGQNSDKLFIIISGEIELYKSAKDGKKQHLITTLKTGESLGEMRLVEDKPCILSAKVASPATLLSLSIRELRMKENNQCFLSLLSSIIKILNGRLVVGNKNVATHIGERIKKKKQLSASLIVIAALAFFLVEVGLGLYYLTHTSDFCNFKNQQQGSESMQGGL